MFAGAENLPPLCGIIDGNIGFGEEPASHKNSFNSIRADAIDEIARTADKEITQALYKKIPNLKQLQDVNSYNSKAAYNAETEFLKKTIEALKLTDNTLKAQNYINPDFINPILNKYNISCDYFHLNASTAKEMHEYEQQIKNQKVQQ